ncbi:MAG: hypothetical protein IJS39_09745, partial [Synergistaceae bacterium]|nr:hypothetical protein [Synergistaceae bacterium]
MWLEILLEGLKKFAGEIIGVVLLVVVLGTFPSVRSWFTKYKKLKKGDDETDIQQALREIEEQRRKEAERKTELELQLEQKHHEEVLKAAEAQKAEEAKRRAEIELQLEAERQEKERIKAEEAKRREELQRQLEEQRKEQERIQAEAKRREELQKQLEDQRRIEQEKATSQQSPAFDDDEFLELCESGDV